MLPLRPAIPPEQCASGSLHVRYEDITQEGRLILETSTTALGETIWRRLLAHHPISALIAAEGIVPILTRLVAEGTPGPFSIASRLTVDGAYEVARSVTTAEEGAPTRLYLNMWAELTAPIGRTRGEPPPNAGEPAVCARLFAEHVFTRLFAPPGMRKVSALPGMDLPVSTYDAKPLAALLELPEGAEWLEPSLRIDPTPLAFGLCHTDSNQHVNSLVYPRLFEEAALRRFAALGKPTLVLSRAMEVGFRKPFFAGQVAKVALRAFAIGTQLGASGVFVGERDAADEHALMTALDRQSHAFVQMRFEA
jgi:hypothetical protein